MKDKALKKYCAKLTDWALKRPARDYRTAVPPRVFVQKGRNIHSSAGRALIHVLPEMATLPDMTAHWESTLTQISEKQYRYQDFMVPLSETLTGLINQARRTGMSVLSVIYHHRRRRRRPARKAKVKPLRRAKGRPAEKAPLQEEE